MSPVDGPMRGFVGWVPAFPACRLGGSLECFPSLASGVAEWFVGVDAHGSEREVDGFAGEVADVVGEAPLPGVAVVADA